MHVLSREVIAEVGYSENSIAMKGAVANFSCPPGLVLIGPNTTTCMENGEWEPDLTNLDCKGRMNQSIDPFTNVLCLLT